MLQSRMFEISAFMSMHFFFYGCFTVPTVHVCVYRNVTCIGYCAKFRLFRHMLLRYVLVVRDNMLLRQVRVVWRDKLLLYVLNVTGS